MVGTWPTTYAGSRFVELPGRDNLPAAGDVGGLVDEIEDFLVGRRTGDAERVLVTLVFTDIVESTAAHRPR